MPTPSRKAVYKWLNRCREQGIAGLLERSRAPQEDPNRVEEVWRQRIRAVRQQHVRWGARKLLLQLQQQYGVETIPSASTVGRLLQELGICESASGRFWPPFLWLRRRSRVREK